jgi:hypothetical protein
MTPEEIRLGEGAGRMEGFIQTEGVSQTEGVGQMGGTGRTVTSGAPAPSAAPKRQVLGGLPSMRSAIVWSEILGKPKALRGKK